MDKHTHIMHLDHLLQSGNNRPRTVTKESEGARNKGYRAREEWPAKLVPQMRCRKTTKVTSLQDMQEVIILSSLPPSNSRLVDASSSLSFYPFVATSHHSTSDFTTLFFPIHFMMQALMVFSTD